MDIRHGFACILAVCLTAPAKALGRARCDLTAFNPPALLLIGECHNCKSSRLVKAVIVRRSSAGEIYGAMECGLDHSFYPWETGAIFSEFSVQPGGNARLFGVDSPLAYGLTMSYGLLEKNEPRDDGFPSSFRWYAFFLAYLHDTDGNPYARRAWEEALKARPGDSRLQALAGKLDENRRSPEPDWDIARRFSDGDFRRLAEGINEAFVALANEKFLPAMGLTGRLSPYSDDNLFTSLQNRRSFESSKEAVTVDVRDKALADNIADVYCAAAGEGMNLVVSIGDAHLPGVEALLKEWSRGRIPLEVERSYEPSPENRESVQESLDAAWPILEKIGRLASPSVR